MDAQEVMHMTDYSKITALYSRLSVGDEDRDGGESNSIQNQKIFLENYARGQHLTNIRHYIDDDESGRFFDRSAYSRMMDDVENGKIGVCIMKDLTRWGRDYLQVGNASRIVPIIRQGQHQRQQPLCLQRQRHIPKMMIGHDRKIFCLFNSEHCHLTSSFLASLYTEQQLQISVFMVVIQIAIVYLGMIL